MCQQPIYVFENGVRKVQPYFFKFKTPIKSRWIGRTLLEVLTVELGQLPKLVQEGISKKNIFIHSNVGRRGGPVVIEGWEKLKDREIVRHDLIYNLQHIHEPSVPDGSELNFEKKTTFPSQVKTDLQIVFEDENQIVINKPSGIPSHASGSYRYNSISEILKHDLNLDKIWHCHRLDKATSGILILALNKQRASFFNEMIEKRKDLVSKSYVARVKGKFPQGVHMYNCPIFSINQSGRYVNQNIQSMPINSTTVFERIKYDPILQESIVICKPITGKMHQIRIHLRNLGYAIVNDSIFNPDPMKSYPSFVKNGIELKLYKKLFKVYPQFEKLQPVNEDVANTKECIDISSIINFHEDEELNKALEEFSELKKTNMTTEKDKYGKKCEVCDIQLFDTNNLPKDLLIWLHAFKYLFGDEDMPFEFETQFPKWCDI